MNAFEYAAPKSLKEAASLLGSAWGETEILAGGTDLVTSLKQGITTPKRVVSLRHIKDLKGIDDGRRGLRIGAMTTLGEILEDKTVKETFPALITAITGVGSAQMISAGTIGGDLCQRPRCWYFRNGFGLLGRQGDTSLVRDGDNRYHAIFGTDGPSLFVSASSLGPVLVALGATISVTGAAGAKRELPAAEFFHAPKSDNERETALRPNEIVTAITIPSRNPKELANATYEVRHRHGLDWPYVTASVAYQRLANGAVLKPQVVLGHVAPVPWVATAAAKALEGARIDEAAAKRCGELAVEGAKPLSGNAYKLQMVKTAVKRALLASVRA
jgi:xanthine dehydrogenase YagS FAD-binding subunit